MQYVQGQVKVCPRCKTEKPHDAFYVSSVTGNLSGWCRPCCSAGQKERRDVIRPRMRRYRLKHCYGLTLEDFDALLASQNGVCAVCGGDAEVVDHDHATGEVRGVLCQRCNKILGFARDNALLLVALADYLKES